MPNEPESTKKVDIGENALGITINIRKDIHGLTETFGSRRNLDNLRDHLAADVKELRVLLRQNGYDNARINVQL